MNKLPYIPKDEAAALVREYTLREIVHLCDALVDRSPCADAETAYKEVKRRVEALQGTVPEEREKIEHLQMQLGYIATELMLAGDKRTMPEIIETAARKTVSPQLIPSEKP